MDAKCWTWRLDARAIRSRIWFPSRMCSRKHLYYCPIYIPVSGLIKAILVNDIEMQQRKLENHIKLHLNPDERGKMAQNGRMDDRYFLMFRGGGMGGGSKNPGGRLPFLFLTSLTFRE